MFIYRSTLGRCAWMRLIRIDQIVLIYRIIAQTSHVYNIVKGDIEVHTQKNSQDRP